MALTPGNLRPSGDGQVKPRWPTGFVNYQENYGSCIDRYGADQYAPIYNFVAFVDDFGTSHPINVSLQDGSLCFLSPHPLPTVTQAATDGSGYVYVLDATPSTKVYPRSGGMIDPFYLTAQDNNGNLISNNGAGVFTDTLNTPVLTVTGAAPNPMVFTYPNPPGVSPATSAVVMNFTSYNVRTNFACSGIVEYGPLSTPLVSSIALPNGTSYSFTYEATPGYAGSVTGRIASVTLPAGGTITYAYPGSNNGIVCADGSARGLTRTTSDSATPTTYVRTGASPSWVTTVTDPQLNQTIINFQAVGQAIYETKRQSFQGSSTLLRTVSTCYNGSAPDCSAATITLPITRRTVYPQLDNGLQAKTDTFYESQHGLTTETDEYAFGNPSPGALLRQTLTTYATLGNGIVDRVASVTVKDGAGAQVAQVTNSYDGSAVTATSGVPQHVAVTGSRGNLTSVSQWLNPGSTNPATFVYDDTGNILSATDSGQHTTSFAYGNTNALVSQTTMPNTSSPNAASHITTATYDTNTGLMTDSGDQNSQHTTYTYDNLWRPLTVNYPDTGQTSFTYTSATQTDVFQKIDSSRNRHSIAQVDGYGRASSTALINAETNPYDQQDTCYNNNGQVAFQSYPYQGGGLGQAKVCSGAGDSFTYDALGRRKTTTHSDGTSVQLIYAGRAMQVTDEGNGSSTVSRILQSDALGRMTGVCEIYSGTPLMGTTGTPAACGLDIGGTGFLTSSAYNVLDNLTAVTQGGQTRSYQYDSLSRLTQETIPEKTGATNYTYNGDGLLYQRVRPAPNQTNPMTTVTTTYTYDELHRPRTAAYSDGVTPSPQWHYDEVFASGWGVNLANTTGRLSQEVVGSTGSAFSYDSLGRVLQNYQCTPRTCFSNAYRLDYSYDLMGNVLSGGNGLGTTLSYGYNAAARLTTMTSSWIDSNHPGTLLSNVHYGAFGLSGSNLGNGLTEAATYNTLGELSSFTAAQGGSTRYSFGLSYAPDGNITSANDSQNGNWSYTYDPFNRLKTAAQSGQALNWDYDRYGNRWHQNVTLGSAGTSSLSFTGSNNHVDGETFDAAGNVTNVGSRVYTYDAENRLITVAGDTTASNVYGPEGRRIKTQAYEYLYDQGGHAIAVLNTSTGANTYDEVYAGGRHLATYFNSTTTFNHTDWLGTERVRTGPSGLVAETCTSLPFGDGQTCTGTDWSFRHFTGDERDPETGLDHTLFRQYQSLEARWLTVDPLGGNFSDPQSLNRYAYVEDDPINFSDPFGLFGITVGPPQGSPVNVSGVYGQTALFLGGSVGRPYYAMFNIGQPPPPATPKPPEDKLDNFAKCVESNRLDNALRALGAAYGHPDIGNVAAGLTNTAAGAAIANQALNLTASALVPVVLRGEYHSTSFPHFIGALLSRATGIITFSNVGKAVGRGFSKVAVATILIEGGYNGAAMARCGVVTALGKP